MGISIPEQDVLFLVFGQISHYKGIPEILDAFREIKRDDLNHDVHLVVAGTVKKGNRNLQEELMMYCSKVPNFYLRDTFIDEETVSLLHNAADVCVFNHRDIMASGSVEMARSYRLPIISPARGCIMDYPDEQTRLFHSLSELQDHLNQFAEQHTR